jgi:replicative DNA helicase
MLVRALADLADVDIWRLLKGMVTREQWPALVQAQSRLMSLNILFDEKASKAKDVERSIRRAHRKGADIVFVDYLQFIAGNAGKQREREIAEISVTLKTLAKQLHIPIIAVAQLSRAVESREDKRPVLADLRDSGQIEQDADIVMFLYREHYYTKREDVRHKAELIFRKGRHIGTATVPLYFDEMKTRFRDWHGG